MKTIGKIHVDNIGNKKERDRCLTWPNYIKEIVFEYLLVLLCL